MLPGADTGPTISAQALADLFPNFRSSCATYPDIIKTVEFKNHAYVSINWLMPSLAEFKTLKELCDSWNNGAVVEVGRTRYTLPSIRLLDSEAGGWHSPDGNRNVCPLI